MPTQCGFFSALSRTVSTADVLLLSQQVGAQMEARVNISEQTHGNTFSAPPPSLIFTVAVTKRAVKRSYTGKKTVNWSNVNSEKATKDAIPFSKAEDPNRIRAKATVTEASGDKLSHDFFSKQRNMGKKKITGNSSNIPGALSTMIQDT